MRKIIAIVFAFVFALFSLSCGQQKPTGPNVTDIQITAPNLKFNLGDEFSLDGLIVTAFYDDQTEKTLESSEYEVDSSAFNSNQEGEYPINVTALGFTKEYKVKVLAPHAKWKEDNVLKILMIGNSFSVDVMSYLYKIAKNAGVENIKLGNLFIPSCSIAMHMNQLKKPELHDYIYYVNDNDSWQTNNGYRSSDAIKSENWDFITFQETSPVTGQADTHYNLPTLMQMVREICNEDAKFGWHMTWAYAKGSTHAGFKNYDQDQMKMYNAICDVVKNVVYPMDGIEFVIPCGTAIQNARTSPYIEDTLTRDTFHLNSLGSYVTGLTLFHAITGLPIDNVDFKPTNIQSYAVPVAIESAKNAVLKPYEVTESVL